MWEFILTIQERCQQKIQNKFKIGCFGIFFLLANFLFMTKFFTFLYLLLYIYIYNIFSFSFVIHFKHCSNSPNLEVIAHFIQGIGMFVLILNKQVEVESLTLCYKGLFFQSSGLFDSLSRTKHENCCSNIESLHICTST